jgi:hypothetical protein
MQAEAIKKMTTIEIPKELHKELRLFCVNTDSKMKEMTVKAVRNLINDKKG